MNYIFNDGGRVKAGFSGLVRDCAARCIAITLDLDYLDVLDDFQGKNVDRYLDYILSLHGYSYREAPTGTLCTNIKGSSIVKQHMHYTTIIDDEIQDIFDTSEKTVYGYWSKN